MYGLATAATKPAPIMMPTLSAYGTRTRYRFVAAHTNMLAIDRTNATSAGAMFNDVRPRDNGSNATPSATKKVGTPSPRDSAGAGTV